MIPVDKQSIIPFNDTIWHIYSGLEIFELDISNKSSSFLITRWHKISVLCPWASLSHWDPFVETGWGEVQIWTWEEKQAKSSNAWIMLKNSNFTFWCGCCVPKVRHEKNGGGEMPVYWMLPRIYLGSMSIKSCVHCKVCLQAQDLNWYHGKAVFVNRQTQAISSLCCVGSN